MRGNGVDLGQIAAMLHTVMQSQAEHTRMLVEHTRMLTEHSRMLAENKRQLDDQANAAAKMRKEIASYHASVAGHGLLITEPDARVSRIGQHLGLAPAH